MSADLEAIVFVLRAGKEYGGRCDAYLTGGMYDFSATVMRRTHDTAEIMAASGKMTPSTWRAIRKALNDAGIRRAFWDRYDGKGRVRRIWVD